MGESVWSNIATLNPKISSNKLEPPLWPIIELRDDKRDIQIARASMGFGS